MFYFNDKLISVDPDFEGKCIVKEGTKSISKRAFYNTEKITEVVLPESLVDLGMETFSCSGLQKINIPRGVSIISDGGGMQDWDDREPTYSVGGMFYSCKYLREVSLPDTLVSIGDGAFYGCESLNSIILPKGLLHIGRYSFAYTGLREIDIYCTSLSTGSFACCENLSRVTFDKDASAIITTGYYEEELQMYHSTVFDNCNSLVDVQLPLRISRFRDLFNESFMVKGVWINSLFYYNNILADVDMENLPSEIRIEDGTLAIAHDLKLGKNGEKVIIPSSVLYADITSVIEEEQKIDDGIDNGVQIEFIRNPFYNGHILFSYPLNNNEILIKEGTQVIAANATSDEDPYFCCRCVDPEKAAKVKNIIIPSSVKIICDGAFSGLGITNLILPDGIEYIGDYAFSICEDLESIQFPKSLKYISPLAFKGCNNLKSIKVPSQCPNSILEMLKNLKIRE